MAHLDTLYRIMTGTGFLSCSRHFCFFLRSHVSVPGSTGCQSTSLCVVYPCGPTFLIPNTKRSNPLSSLGLFTTTTFILRAPPSHGTCQHRIKATPHAPKINASKKITTPEENRHEHKRPAAKERTQGPHQPHLLRRRII